MYGLMLGHPEGIVIVVDGDMPAIYESVEFSSLKHINRHSLWMLVYWVSVLVRVSLVKAMGSHT